jgi:hypothetical protein
MISVRDHRALEAAVLALKVMDRSLRNDINRSTKSMLDPIWKGAVQANAHSTLDKLVVARGARVKGGNPPEAIAATSRKALSGGLMPQDKWPIIEFGGTYNKVETYTSTSPKGRTFPVTRHTARQVPATRKSGRIAYKALAEVTPRVVSLWVQMIVAKTYEAIEGGR